jgi:hypothetical protein
LTNNAPDKLEARDDAGMLRSISPFLNTGGVQRLMREGRLRRGFVVDVRSRQAEDTRKVADEEAISAPDVGDAGRDNKFLGDSVYAQ